MFDRPTPFTWLTTAAILVVLLAGCGDSGNGKGEKTGGGGEPPKKHGTENPDMKGDAHGHGDAKTIANVTVGGAMFEVKMGGSGAPGGDAFFDIVPQDEAGKADGAKLTVWFEDEEGNMVSPAGAFALSNGKYHGHLGVPANKKAATRLKIRFRCGDVDATEVVPVPADAHGGKSAHAHGAHGPHGGIIAHLSGDGVSGHVELKLHDDKGDLELWLYADGECKVPFDVGLDTTVLASFPKLKDRSAELTVRNREKNEDEGGNANIRDGKTNYFVFPGHTDVDTEWLQGKAFSSEVQLVIADGGKVYKSDTFNLHPHAH